MARLLWRVRALARTVGWAGMGTLGLLGAGLLAQLLLLFPLHTKVDAMRTEIAEQAASALPVKAKPVVEVDRLTDFFRGFPQGDLAPDVIGKIYGAAESRGLVLERGEYHMVSVSKEKLVRYEIVLPVRGAYLPIRQFVAQALSEVPTLALDSIAFTREKIDEPVVDAELHLTLFLSKP